jgi:hypothetical protein
VSALRSSTSRGRTRLARITLLALTLAVVAALGLFASACGGSSSEGVAQVETSETTTEGSTSTPDSASGSGDAAAYSACMRSNGLHEFPDPDSNGRIRLKGGPGTDLDPESARFKAAAKACEELAPPEDDALSPAEQAEAREELLAFSSCMRENGLPDFPDPTSNAEGGISITGGDFDPDSPQFKAAEMACEHLLSGAETDSGTSGSGGTP